jgi:hypothetical protein
MLLLANASRTTDEIDICWLARRRRLPHSSARIAGRCPNHCHEVHTPTHCRILLPQTAFAHESRAQRVLDRYLLPDAKREEAETIASSLDVLFGSEREREP